MIHIVIDLEMNPIVRSMKDIRRFIIDEVIEFGAVKLDEKYQPIDEFQCYVKPQFCEINKHITKLTGITNEMVADKKSFAEEFKNFFDWIGTWDMMLYSWSPSDIKQLRSECAYKIPDFDSEKMERQWIDIQKEFDDKYVKMLNALIGQIGEKFDGDEKFLWNFIARGIFDGGDHDH